MLVAIKGCKMAFLWLSSFVFFFVPALPSPFYHTVSPSPRRIVGKYKYRYIQNLGLCVDGVSVSLEDTQSS